MHKSEVVQMSVKDGIPFIIPLFGVLIKGDSSRNSSIDGFNHLSGTSHPYFLKRVRRKGEKGDQKFHR